MLQFTNISETCVQAGLFSVLLISGIVAFMCKHTHGFQPFVSKLGISYKYKFIYLYAGEAICKLFFVLRRVGQPFCKLFFAHRRIGEAFYKLLFIPRRIFYKNTNANALSGVSGSNMCLQFI